MIMIRWPDRHGRVAKVASGDTAEAADGVPDVDADYGCEPLRRTKINGADPPLTSVCTAYATPPFLTFSNPPIKLTSFRLRGRLQSALSAGVPAANR